MSDLRAIEVGGVTRAAFILRGALAAGALYGADAAGPFVARALAQTAGADVDVINFALTLENLESSFYKAALAKVSLAADVKKLATEIGSHEAQHATLLSQTITELGGTPAAAPATSFPLSDQGSFLGLAQKLEETGVAAYNGAASLLQSPDLLSAAGAIAQVEARHAAALRLRNGQPPAPAAADPARSQAAVQAAVKPYLK